MEDLLSGGGLGMGFLFFGIMVVSVVRRKAGNVIARGQYPALGARLGLRYEPSTYKHGVGRLVGNYRGFRLTVDPDDGRKIYVKFETLPAVSLHNYAHNKRPHSGQRSFRPSSRILSEQFKTAHGSDELIERLNDDSSLPQLIKPLKFLRQLKTLSVTENGVTAVFDYGNPPFIPASVVEDVVPRLVALARVFEVPRSTQAAASSSSGTEVRAAQVL